VIPEAQVLHSLSLYHTFCGYGVVEKHRSTKCYFENKFIWRKIRVSPSKVGYRRLDPTISTLFMLI